MFLMVHDLKICVLLLVMEASTKLKKSLLQIKTKTILSSRFLIYEIVPTSQFLPVNGKLVKMYMQ